MKVLARHNREKVIDLLNERLTFERSGVRLYDAIIDKAEKSSESGIARLLGRLREHRAEEKEHEEWLEQQIRELGGDAEARTELSRLVAAESRGIEEVVLSGGHNVKHLFHALLAAELVDNAGWQLLLELADEADDVEARKQFEKRLHEEQDHLILVRQAALALASRDVLGYQQQLPDSP